MINNVNTYNGLVASITKWANRNDSSFIENIPVFISLTEQEIFIKLSTLGNEYYVTSSFTPNNGIIPKPGDWGKTSKIFYIDSNNKTHVLFRLSVPTLEVFNPDVEFPSGNPAGSNLPRYYSDYGYPYIIISPTPAEAFNYTLSYFTKIPPLSVTNQTNWNSRYAYDMLFFGCMQKAFAFLNDTDWATYFGNLYTQGISDYNSYDKQRLTDASVAVENE